MLIRDDSEYFNYLLKMILIAKKLMIVQKRAYAFMSVLLGLKYLRNTPKNCI